MIIGTNAFRWRQYYAAPGANLDDHLDEAIPAAARAGLQTWEPLGLASEAVTERLGGLLRANGMRMASLYVNCRLHDDGWRESIDAVLEQARWARAQGLGTSVVCTNPEPVAWGSPEDKDDAQLRRQAAALRELGERLNAEGMRLAYHVHASELRQGAREFHGMMALVPPEAMGFCLDAHWIWRGCGNSQVAVEAALALYADRIVSVHLRQSHGGVWTEHLEDGDLDHASVIACLRRTGFDGPLLIEHGYENGTPETLTLEEAHRRSRAWVRENFGV